MSNVIFCRPNDEYESYSDLWHIVALSGYPVIRLSELDPESDNCYIFSTPSTRWHDGSEHRGWPDAKARIIYYNIEWYPDVDYKDIPGVEIWSADKWHADKIGAKYVPLGSHVGLPIVPLEDCPKVWDVVMLSYMTNRRQQMVAWLREAGIPLAMNSWGMDRHYTLQKSKLMLHVHQNDGIRTIAPQRWAIAAAYKLPIISEDVSDLGFLGYTHGIYAEYKYLVDVVKMWKDDRRMVDFGLALHQALCVDNNFRTFVEAAL